MESVAQPDLSYVRDRLQRAILTMLTLPALPRHRLMVAFAENQAWVMPGQFPTGELRDAYRSIRDRIEGALPRGAVLLTACSEAFGALSDDDITWLIEQLHALAFSAAVHTHATKGAMAGSQRDSPE